LNREKKGTGVVLGEINCGRVNQKKTIKKEKYDLSSGLSSRRRSKRAHQGSKKRGKKNLRYPLRGLRKSRKGATKRAHAPDFPVRERKENNNRRGRELEVRGLCPNGRKKRGRGLEP